MGTLKDKIRNAQDIKSEPVDVPEWDATVEVRTITGAERADIFSQNTDGEGKIVASQAMYQLMVAATFDPGTGERLFTPEDIDWLRGKSAKAVERIASVASRLAGISPDAIKDAEKNS